MVALLGQSDIRETVRAIQMFKNSSYSYKDSYKDKKCINFFRTILSDYIEVKLKFEFLKIERNYIVKIFDMRMIIFLYK